MDTLAKPQKRWVLPRASSHMGRRPTMPQPPCSKGRGPSMVSVPVSRANAAPRAWSGLLNRSALSAARLFSSGQM